MSKYRIITYKLYYIINQFINSWLNPAADRIIEIGMARVCNGNVADTYSTLVNPGIKISDRIIELTHITFNCKLELAYITFSIYT